MTRPLTTLLITLLAVLTITAQPQQRNQRRTNMYGKRLPLWEQPDFFKTDTARLIADQVIMWQRVTGGWPKNQDMATPMTDEQRQKVLADKQRRDDSTTDNNATTQQMTYLARVYQATGEARYREAFCKGVEYLLAGQYKNGGWPQFWPVQRDYQIHITYNDNAMVNTMTMLRDIYNEQSPYNGMCDKKLKSRLIKAFNKGVECILNTQCKGAIWCQQHDRETLLPASARAYELPSYSPQESAAILKLLMQIPNPSQRVKDAIHTGMAWLDKYKITGLEVKRVMIKGTREATLQPVKQAKATDERGPRGEIKGVLWARYYDLDTCTPYFCDRDGIKRRRLEDIGTERRNGYAWFGQQPAELYPLYNEWADKYDPQHKVAIDLFAPGANENGTITLGQQPQVDESIFDAIVTRGGNIQEAIDRAPLDGTKPYTILIKKGLYNQRVVINRPNIVLVGEQRDSVIIVGAEAQGTARFATANPHDKGARGIIYIDENGNDCLITGITAINNYGTTVTNTTTHQFTIYGRATRTIVINSNIISDGNDALSLWGRGDDGKGGMYYHSDLYVRCPGVDFVCPRGTCYATRCKFVGDTRAILWHDGRGDKDNKFVVTNSEFDALKPTPLGRYHHDSQFFIVNCKLSNNIIDHDIDHAYRAEPHLAAANGKTIDPCPWGHRVYYIACTRDGGNSGWLNDNVGKGDDTPTYFSTNATWTFAGRWDPEARIRDLWQYVAY